MDKRLESEFSRRTFLKTGVAAALCTALPRWLPAADAATRPNILLIIADDWGWGYSSILGDPVLQTPNFDRVAKEGALLRNAYCAAPSCTPSRASILTGQEPYRLGEGVHLGGYLEPKHQVYPDLLEKAGYAVGMDSKGWAPGDPEASGRSRNPAGPKFGNFEEFLQTLKTGQPFCYWSGVYHPHRPWDQAAYKDAVDPSKIPVPAFLPDSPEVREDLAQYYGEILALDAQIGRLLKALEETSRLDNTMVVITSDNGMPFPGAKLNLYDSGTRMPTAARWPGKIPAGQVLDPIVNLTDLAPTFLAAAGLPAPSEMTGVNLLPLLESGQGGRDFVVTARERHNKSVFPARAIRNADFLYIRNANTSLTTGLGDVGPTTVYFEANPGNPKVKELLSRAGAGPRPPEELYEVRKDPDQLRNLAEDPAYADIKTCMANQLQEYLLATGDPRAAGQGEFFDNHPNRIKPRQKKIQ